MDAEHFTSKFTHAKATPQARAIAQKVVSTLRQGMFNESIQVSKDLLDEIASITGQTINKTCFSLWMPIFDDQGRRVDITHTGSAIADATTLNADSIWRKGSSQIV